MLSPTPPNLPSTGLAYALAEAAGIVAGVFAGQSLADGALARVEAKARPGVQDLVYGTLRDYGRGDFFLARLLERPLNVPVVHALLLAAIYRLDTRPEAAHTVVDQAVAAAGTLAGGRLRGLVNAVLRNFLRQRETLEAAAQREPVAALRHPQWWLDLLRTTHENDWKSIVEAGNTPPPMALRVNTRRIDADSYLAQLPEAGIAASRSAAPDLATLADTCLLLAQPQPVDALPGFRDGLVSVQDPGAQRAAGLLDPAPGSRVLDACAAPGGKTAHLLERADLDLLALDLKPTRCRRIEDNLQRLGLAAEVKVADCIKRDTWWDDRPFDAILADVPCTASGVVRRHPDAKWLRRPEDVASFAATQKRILDSLWLTLRPGGRFLYATCSVFAAENDEQIEAFLQRQPEARELRRERLLPGPEHDGFFYALLEKHG